MKTIHQNIEKLQKVSLDEIDLKDRTFCMSFGRDKRALCESILKRGLITPCLLRHAGTRPLYQIIMGFRRLEVCQDLEITSIKAFVIDREEMGDEEALMVALYENLSTRGLNLIERSKVMERLEDRLGWEKGRIVKDILPAMGLEPSAALVESYLSLVRLINPLKRLLLDKEVSLSNACRLSAFSHEAQRDLAMVLPGLKLNENILKELLIFLNELMRKEQIPLSSILARTGILELINDEGLSKHQRTQRVRKAIWTERYPMLSRMMQEFEDQKKALHLPPEISLQHSPYFEEEGIRLSFRFSKTTTFKEIVERLQAISNSDKITRLLEIGTKLPK